MKKRTKRMETALKVIQTCAEMDATSNSHIQSRAAAMNKINLLAMKALRKKAKPE